VQVGDVEPADAALRRLVLGQVARIAAHPLISAGAEGVRPLAGEDDHADVEIVARPGEGVGDLDQRLRAEGVTDLRAVDGDLRDAVAGRLVADVRVLAGGAPGHVAHGRSH
jgi:hypothetical protein